ncbi:hypothetical protein [Sandaracinus amylolyticus]|uniref:hypothetical protein n=1 Tax=Sandaracinus amylolyticus TaxID=927083 RepID=UPI001F1778B9|nr:hypothetical protein [Sandaracinus amylolyticus]UJR78381.1 Hypothetical protein I5071_4080 [Sandaracinus amylolyticus]
MSSRKIELTWVCTSCGHRNLGRFAECKACGSPKDASERYQMPGDTRAAPTVSDPALLRLAHAGANWRCTFCGTESRALVASCEHCGAQRGPAVNVIAPPSVPRAPARTRGRPG